MFERENHFAKKPWCERAMTRLAALTITEQQTWKHAPRMFLGSMLQLLVVAGCIGLHASLAVLYFKWLMIDTRKPSDPSFWSSALPAWGIAITIFAVIFLLSLTITLPGKQRMKRALLPIRCQRCPKCFYDLSHRPRTNDICPECGVVAPRRECVRLWCKLLRSRF